MREIGLSAVWGGLPGTKWCGQERVLIAASEACGQLARKNNTMIVPGHMGEGATLSGRAMALFKGGATRGP